MLIPDSGMKFDLWPIARLTQFISRRLSSSTDCTVIPACDLLVGKKTAHPDEALAAFSSWGAVHGTNASYTRMALSLVDNYFGKPSSAVPVQRTGLKPRAESTSSYQSGPAAGQPIPALNSFRLPAARQPSLPGFTRGGTRGASNGRRRDGSRSGKWAEVHYAAPPRTIQISFCLFFGLFYCVSQFTCVLSFLCAIIYCKYCYM